jgi:hypothetical protein
MNYLDGEQLNKSELKNYVGRRCQYLLKRDIDKTGRGYFFPRSGVITFANKRQVDFDDRQEFHSILSDLREIVLLEVGDE